MQQLTKILLAIVLLLLSFGKPVYSASIEHRVVFMGNSITEGWGVTNPAFFAGKPYINSGIGGQTTSQMLERFQRDVVNYLPTVVVILAGTNDIAGNGGATTVKKIQARIASMAQLATSNGIKVVLGSVLPVYKYPWNQSVNPIDSISSLNNLIKAYAQENEMIYADFYSPMVNEQMGLKSQYSGDGVHPNLAGYKVMEPIVLEAIDKAMALAGIDPLMNPNGVVATKITMYPTALSLDKNDSRQLYARLSPINAISEVSWSSDNESVATVNSTGLVTAKAGGTATITVLSSNNAKTASCVVTVNDNGFTKFEAENATIGGPGGPRFVKDQQGYSGTGFVAPFGTNGDYVQFSITGATAGSQDVILRYAAADGASMNVYVNGTKIKQISFSGTGCWGCWTDNVTNLTLNAGNNTIRYKKDAGDWGHINIDYLAVKDLSTGITETSNDANALVMYPNPLTKGPLTVQLPIDAAVVSVLDMTGKTIYQKQVAESELQIGQEVFQSDGVYIVNVITSTNSINKKLILTR